MKLRREVFDMQTTNELYQLHSSISLLIDSFMKHPEYRRYVLALSRAEYITDSVLVTTQNEELNGKTKANRTISKVFP
jgi:hypothetical protein